MNEPQWTAKICKLIQDSNIASLKNIYPERSYKKEFESILRTYFSAVGPKFMAKPDLIMVFEDDSRKFDDYLLVALELKYFEPSDNLDKNLRKAFREVGQALRYHLFGFDSAILWHTFAEDIKDKTIIPYSELIGEFFEKLELPLVYFSTKTLFSSSFRVFKPVNVQGNLEWLIRWMHKTSQDRRNPLLRSDIEYQKFIQRRRALKAVLRVP
jgi:hypothetical protein